MRGDDLDVLDSATPIAVLVLDPHIRQLDVSVLVRQLVLLGPSSDCLLAAFRRLSALTTSPAFSMQEPLILALQILFEDYAADRLTPFRQAFGCLHVRAVEPGIVGQLTRLVDADVERLAVTFGARPSRSFEDVSAAASKRHQRRPRAPHDIRNGLHKAKIAKALEIASRATWDQSDAHTFTSSRSGIRVPSPARDRRSFLMTE